MATIEDRVRGVIAKWVEIRPEDIRDEASVVDDLGADSMIAVQIVLELEKEFGIEIPDDEVDHIKVVKEAIEYVRGKLAKP